MTAQAVDHVSLLPLYLAAGTAVLVLLADLLVARPAAVYGALVAGGVATAAGAIVVGGSRVGTFCAPGGGSCSWTPSPLAATAAVVFAGLTIGVLGLSVPSLKLGTAPAGEFCFLLACSMTGGVVVGYAGDLITLIVGVETL